MRLYLDIAGTQTHTFLKQETCPQSLAMPDDKPTRVDSGMACVAKCRAHEGAGAALFYATGEPARPQTNVVASRRAACRCAIAAAADYLPHCLSAWAIWLAADTDTVHMRRPAVCRRVGQPRPVQLPH